MTSFSDLGLAPSLLAAVEQAGHQTPTPIQVEVIPAVLDGRDVLGLAQTGSGKTAAFALPLLHLLAARGEAVKSGKAARKKRRPRQCRAVIIAPTRELAAQIQDQFDLYGATLGLQSALLIGGAPINKQIANVRAGAEIIVATPGRFVDLLQRGIVKANLVEALVLDEVDQMLDLGFIHDIRAIIAALPDARQNIFLSATMPKVAQRLADQLLNDPISVEITNQEKPKITESVLFLGPKEKPKALLDLVKKEGVARGLVFTRTKYGADRVARALKKEGVVAFAIHGDRSQSQRQRALEAFRDGRAPILVATDIAARGIDVPDVTHVVNFDVPNVPETYVHRIGRTGRAGAAGQAVSFCSPDERPYLHQIERRLKRKVPIIKVIGGAPLAIDDDLVASSDPEAQPQKQQPQRQPRQKASVKRKAAKKRAAKAEQLAEQAAKPARKKHHRKGRRPAKAGEAREIANAPKTDKKSKSRHAAAGKQGARREKPAHRGEGQAASNEPPRRPRELPKEGAARRIAEREEAALKRRADGRPATKHQGAGGLKKSDESSRKPPSRKRTSPNPANGAASAKPKKGMSQRTSSRSAAGRPHKKTRGPAKGR